MKRRFPVAVLATLTVSVVFAQSQSERYFAHGVFPGWHDEPAFRPKAIRYLNVVSLAGGFDGAPAPAWHSAKI